jgi:hypothetical protein
MTPAGPCFLLAAAALVSLAWATPASAAIEGPCTAAFNGIEASRIDSLSSPLLLGDDETLVFSGTDPVGTRNATVSVLLGPAILGRAASSSGTPEGAFSASLDLTDVARYGVGLVRVRAATDNCTADAWLRVGGRLPFTTLVGLTGTGLALAGLTGQVSALAARRRWAAPVAAAAGVATGTGGALLGQQFGRLQLSYWSLGGTVAFAVLVGLALALALRPRLREGLSPSAPRHDGAWTEPEPPDAQAAVYDEAAPPAAPAEPQRPAEAARPASAPARTPVSEPFWCYVMAVVEVLHLDDHTRVVATLRPGTWYLAKREVSGWAQVVAAEGVEGWVPRQALRREG